MTVEPLSYRARKWLVQETTTRLGRNDQHERLNERDWDVCIVLDACRWDTLDAVADWPIGRARSPGSATDEWLSVAEETGIFDGANVATANVKYSFFDVRAAETASLWETDWNRKLGTVLPGPVIRRANRFLEESDRPVVAHLLPPHAPYVAKVGDDWLSAFPDTDAWSNDPSAEGDRLSAQVAMTNGYIDLKRARRVYRATVRSTWEEVADAIGRWVNDGHEVVLTADHGETFGRIREFGLCGHPNRCHVAPLVDVPFEVFRPRAEPEADLDVEDKLRALGYKE